MNLPPSRIAFLVTAIALAASARAQEPGRKPGPHAAPDLSKLPPAAAQAGLTYAKDIRPILEASCFRCHGEEKQKGDLRVDSLDALLKGGKEGKDVIPGDGTKSPLTIAVARIDEETAMPPNRRRGPGGPGGRGPGGGPGGPPPGGEAQRPPTPDGKPGAPAGGDANPPGGQPQPGGPEGRRGPGPGGPGGPGGGMAKPLTPEQVGLVRAWIDQGAK
jgi:hypothetical protein